MTASTATAALRARRRHHVSHPSALFTPTEGIELDAVSREAIDRQFVLETRRSEPALVADHLVADHLVADHLAAFDAVGRWQDAQFTALQQAVEEAFTDAVHELVRPYVDPSRRGSTGPLPTVTELGSVPPPTIATPGVRRGEVDLDVDLDDQPTRLIARTTPSRRELRSRQRDRERSRVVLARKVATGGVLAMAAISTVAVAGPKVLQRIGSAGAGDAELSLASSLAPRPTTGAASPALGASGGLAPAAKTAGLTTVTDASKGAGAAVVQLMQAQIAAEATEQARLKAEADRQAAVQKASRSAARAPAKSGGTSGGSSSSTGGTASGSSGTTSATATSGGSGKTPDSARAIAQGMIGTYGWSSSQFQCLNLLWNRESGWKYTAKNPSSGAYGIPQALPGSKMISAGSDWRTNPRTQIAWGLSYIKSRYGTPCAAWAHSEATNWY